MALIYDYLKHFYIVKDINKIIVCILTIYQYLLRIFSAFLLSPSIYIFSAFLLSPSIYIFSAFFTVYIYKY